MKHQFLSAILLLAATLSTQAATNLLSNGDFETAQTNAFYGAIFDSWNFGAEIAIETTDIHGGAQAFRTVNVSMKRDLNQEIDLQSDVVGQEYELSGYYKVLSANAGDLALACQWNYLRPQTGTPHDSVILNQPLDVTNTSWQQFSVKTTKPQDGSSLYFAVAVKKGVKVIFDDFSVTRTEKTTPWFTVTPETVSSSDCVLGDSTLVADFTIRQGNLTQPINLYLTGDDPSMWRLEKTQATAAEENIKLWYKPTAAGKHSAAFSVESSEASTYNKPYFLYGTCIDTTQAPTITIAPTTLPTFYAKVGQTVVDSVLLTSENCIDHVYATITPVGNGFSINSSLFLKNTSSYTYITFSPAVVGSVTDTITWTTTKGQSQTLIVTGVATEADPTEVDWQTDFQWNSTATPLTLLKEPFDTIRHNKTLLFNGWQNVVKQGARPWWGYEDKNNDGEHCAKATAYISGVADSTMYEMWLVTPALDFKNAANKVFTFRVRGDYLRDGQSATLKIYYIDATDPTNAYFEDLNISNIPATEDEAGDWLDFQVNLNNQTTIADVFHIGFCFTGYSGTTGAATYLIDDVSWGRTDLPVITPNPTQLTATVKPAESITLPITVDAKNLTEAITITLAGDNKSKFSVSETTLPTTGGSLAVTFQSDTIGVHQAYLRIRSRGAVDVYVPMAILVKDNTAVDNIFDNENQDGIRYNILGLPVDDSYQGIVIKQGKKYFQSKH